MPDDEEEKEDAPPARQSMGESSPIVRILSSSLERPGSASRHEDIRLSVGDADATDDEEEQEQEQEQELLELELDQEEEEEEDELGRSMVENDGAVQWSVDMSPPKRKKKASPPPGLLERLSKVRLLKDPCCKSQQSTPAVHPGASVQAGGRRGGESGGEGAAAAGAAAAAAG